MAAIYAPQTISKYLVNQIFKAKSLRGRTAKFWLNCTNEKKTLIREVVPLISSGREHR